MTSSVADPSRLRGLLEPLAGKLAWAVLRGRGRSNAHALPDRGAMGVSPLPLTCRKVHR
jgi:hypothetical protein